MKIHILFRPNSEHARSVEEYTREFMRRRNTEIEHVNIDTREGSTEAELYGIMEYPAILVIKDDGELLISWQGETFPLMDELASYANV